MRIESRSRAIGAILVIVAMAGCASSPTGATPVATSPPASLAATPSPTPTAASTATPKPTPAPTLASTTEVATKAPQGAIAIDMTPDALTPRFKPDAVTAKAGTVTFFLTSIPISAGFGPHHDMLIGAEIGTPIATSGQVQPDTSAVFTVEGLAPGTYRFWCNTNTGHGPHQTLGMVGTLTVT